MYMETQPATSNKKKFLILSVFVAALLFAALMMIQKGRVSPQAVLQTEQTPQEIKQPSNIDEVALQRQLQNILAKGKETDCATLSDKRYQLACRDFFRIRNKK